MTTYRNVKHTERDRECTNIVACKALGTELPVGDCWEEADEDILDGLTKIHRLGDIEYYGYL